MLRTKSVLDITIALGGYTTTTTTTTTTNNNNNNNNNNNDKLHIVELLISLRDTVNVTEKCHQKGTRKNKYVEYVYNQYLPSFYVFGKIPLKFCKKLKVQR